MRAFRRSSLLADPHRVRMGDAEGDVIAHRPEVGHVVVHPFELEQDAAQHPSARWWCARRRILESQAVGKVVADRRVTGDPFRQFDTGGGGAALEQPLDALVDEPQPGLDVQDGLADDREAEVARLDDAGVHRTDGDLVDARAFHGEEGVRLGLVVECRWGTGIVPHRVPALGPVLVEHQAGRLMMADEADAEQVLHLALEPPDRERDVGQAGQLEVVDRQSHVDLGPSVRRAGNHDVHDSDGLAPRVVGQVVMGSDEGEPAPRLGQVDEVAAQVGRCGVDDPFDARWSGGGGHRASTSAAAWRSREIGQMVTPSAAAATRPATSGTRAVSEVT